MVNIINEIEEIVSYDDIDNDEKLDRIIRLCNRESVNYNRLISRVRLLESKISKLRAKV